MLASTVIDKGQTTVPQKAREALGIEPGQRLVWEIRKDGSAIVRPLPSVMALAGSLKSGVPFTSIPDETKTATNSWVDETRLEAVGGTSSASP